MNEHFVEKDIPPSNTRRIAIDPVTRVEGHGKITLQLDEQGKVVRSRFHVVEFRGFERFIQGRMYWEVPVIVQRLCGICPVSHHLAAGKAMDQIAGVDQLTPTADKIRRLMHYGQVLQSDAVHLFHLASPDLLLGFDSDPEKRNIFGVIDQFPEIGKWGIEIRKFGQEVIVATGARRIHPRLVVPGGVNQNLSIEWRDNLRGRIDQILDWCIRSLELHKEQVEKDKQLYLNFSTIPSNYATLLGSDGRLDIYDGTLRAINSNGQTIFESLEAKDYTKKIAEETRNWSYIKFPYFRDLGKEKGWYRVGPLAQINTCDYIDTPLAEAERKKFLNVLGQGKIVHSTLAYHWARLIAMIHCAEKIKEYLYDDDLQGNDLIVTGKKRRSRGIAWIEAPRGTLIHEYEVDKNDQVISANLIVSTTHNNEGMNRAVARAAQQYISGKTITEGLLNRLEVAVRAYDPCLSCASHALGNMPLVVTLEDADGSILDIKSRT